MALVTAQKNLLYIKFEIRKQVAGTADINKQPAARHMPTFQYALDKNQLKSCLKPITSQSKASAIEEKESIKEIKDLRRQFMGE